MTSSPLSIELVDVALTEANLEDSRLDRCGGGVSRCTNIHKILLTAVSASVLLGFAFNRIVPGVHESALRREDASKDWDRLYKYTIKETYFQMDDGVNLAVTLVVPEAKIPGERFPVILEYLPYRKDDSFYISRQGFKTFFGSRGFAFASVDIRGTGSSFGELIPKEYSDIEMTDGEKIISILSTEPWSNGNVGMTGISWGCFNSLMMSARQPPALKAIYCVAGSEDLYYNDIHYMDGMLHWDEYIVSMDHENSIPRSPDYEINDEYFQNRFDKRPWHMLYLENQLDSPFWRTRSMMYNYSKLQIPMYLVTGMADSYKDFALRIYEGVRAENPNPPEMKVSVGPWDHSWPDDCDIQPNYDGRGEAARWFDLWLRGKKDNGILEEPDVAVYVRNSSPPNVSNNFLPGNWRWEDWPIKRTRSMELFPSVGRSLQSLLPLNSEAKDLSLSYVAAAGVEMGTEFGELLPDQKPYDDNSLIFDYLVMDEIRLIGFANVSLVVTTSATLANWFVRLEDVQPNGQVSFVTGGALNGAHRNGRDVPSKLEPGKEYTLTFQMHFTSWVFPPGHKLRIAITNAMHRVSWPSALKMTTHLKVNHPQTWIRLPIVSDLNPQVPSFTQNAPDERFLGTLPKDAFWFDDGGYPYDYFINKGDLTTVTWHSSYFAEMRNTFVGTFLGTNYAATTTDPAIGTFEGYGIQLYLRNFTYERKTNHSEEAGEGTLSNYIAEVPKSFGFPSHRTDSIFNYMGPVEDKSGGTGKPVPGHVHISEYAGFELRTYMKVTSNETHFIAHLHRNLTVRSEAGGPIKLFQRTFDEVFKRQFQ